MKVLYFALLLFSFKLCNAQIERAFITKTGNYTNDPKAAISYLLIQKLNDTAYAVKQYDMRDTIICAGYYKDEQLSIPNGKFFYYAKVRPNKYPTIIDTNNFVQTSGYFVNGKREGVWVEYDPPHIRSSEYTYENGKLNGAFKKYYNDYSGQWAEGQMIDNKEEGEYKVYNADSLLIEEINYVHNKSVKTILHFHPAVASEDQFKFLENKLKKYRDVFNASKAVPFVKFIVTSDGHVRDPQIVKGIKPEIDSVLIAAMLQMPTYIPADYDGKLCEQKILMPVILYDKMIVIDRPRIDIKPTSIIELDRERALSR
jgi:antitoxin component YwqK of YwqJK toxin-antitoxin module